MQQNSASSASSSSDQHHNRISSLIPALPKNQSPIQTKTTTTISSKFDDDDVENCDENNKHLQISPVVLTEKLQHDQNLKCDENFDEQFFLKMIDKSNVNNSEHTSYVQCHKNFPVEKTETFENLVRIQRRTPDRCSSTPVNSKSIGQIQVEDLSPGNFTDKFCSPIDGAIRNCKPIFTTTTNMKHFGYPLACCTPKSVVESPGQLFRKLRGTHYEFDLQSPPISGFSTHNNQHHHQQQQQQHTTTTNPFENSLLDKLHTSTCSPQLFSTVLSPDQEMQIGRSRFWSIDQIALMNPTDIDLTDYQTAIGTSSTKSFDHETESQLQATVDKFFAEKSVVPSPWTSSVPLKCRLKTRRRLIHPQNENGNHFDGRYDKENCDSSTGSDEQNDDEPDSTFLTGNDNDQSKLRSSPLNCGQWSMMITDNDVPGRNHGKEWSCSTRIRRRASFPADLSPSCSSSGVISGTQDDPITPRRRTQCQQNAGTQTMLTFPKDIDLIHMLDKRFFIKDDNDNDNEDSNDGMIVSWHYQQQQQQSSHYSIDQTPDVSMNSCSSFSSSNSIASTNTSLRRKLFGNNFMKKSHRFDKELPIGEKLKMSFEPSDFPDKF